MGAPPGHKASLEVDPAKVAAAREILGTETLAATVDAALSEVIKLRQRKALVELLFSPGRLDDPDVLSSAWR